MLGQNWNNIKISLLSILITSFILITFYESQTTNKIINDPYMPRICRTENQLIQKRMSRFVNLPNRENFSLILNEFGMSTMIELGVAQGQFALSLLANWDPAVFKHYHGLDAWGLKRKDGKGEFPDYYDMVSWRLNNLYGKNH
jgi:hypothetical protein